MDIRTPLPTSTTRTTRPSVSAVLIVGLLIGVTISTFKPGVRGLIRDSVTDGQATRHITATLARAVRELVGSDRHRPAISLGVIKVRSSTLVLAAIVHAGPAVEDARLLRESLLATPPPAA